MKLEPEELWLYAAIGGMLAYIFLILALIL